MKLLLSVALAFVVVQAQNDASRLVNIKQGPVKGYKMPGLDVFAFYSIPFAKVPTGADKYKPPLPPPTWTEPFEAVNKDVLCLQFNIFPPGKYEFVEDCLVISVYTPDTNQTNLPVFVYIHGGSFASEYGNIEPPGQLVNQGKNFVGVTFNYRLGPIGFLCLGTPDVPGNAGMRDQVTALKWIQQNIAAFGGNPNDVTIAGCSAGGASVDLHILTKASKGLFKRVIGQSGANIGAFAVQADPTRNARVYAKSLGYNGTDSLEAIEEFYKTVSYDQLLSVSLHDSKYVEILMAPCLERDLGIERFLEETPLNIINSGEFVRYPILYGWAGMEGILRLEHFDNWKIEMNENFKNFLPSDLEFESEEVKQKVADRVKEYYFGDAVTNDKVLNYIDYHSDVMFNVAMQRAITMQVEAGNDAMYVGVYTYTDNNTMVIPYVNARGANHCDQTAAILDQSDDSHLTEEFIELRKAWREIWVNFITTGEPTPDGKIPPPFPKWESANSKRTPCMEIGNNVRIYPGPYDEERQRLWDELYDKYKRQPIAPYDF